VFVIYLNNDIREIVSSGGNGTVLRLTLYLFLYCDAEKAKKLMQTFTKYVYQFEYNRMGENGIYILLLKSRQMCVPFDAIWYGYPPSEGVGQRIREWKRICTNHLQTRIQEGEIYRGRERDCCCLVFSYWLSCV
jgi:hypothetical protein